MAGLPPDCEIAPSSRPGRRRLNPVGEVQVWVTPRSSRSRRVLAILLTALGLWGAGTVLVFSFRWGLQLMLDPDALPWLQAIPWAGADQGATSLTLKDLDASLRATGYVRGEPISLHSGTRPAVLLIPIQAQAGKTIQTLQLYQVYPGSQHNDRLQLMTTVEVASLSPDAVLAPFSGLAQRPESTPTNFPFNQLTLLPPSPSGDNTWLTLEGRWQQQGITLRYGQLLYVDPDSAQVSLLTPWSSPVDQLPSWVDLDGVDPSDILVNETVGLEPALTGLQVLKQQGMGPKRWLQPVLFTVAPISRNDQMHTYQSSLRLARLRLWGEAHRQLQQLKAALKPKEWPPEAEAQLRLIDYHAHQTQLQADQDWSSPQQHLLALLVDARWESALNQLEQSPELLNPLLRRLSTDDGRFWNRVLAATSLPQPDPAVYVWGGLSLQAQDSPQAAQSWFDRQQVAAAVRQRYQTVLHPAPPNPLLGGKPGADLDRRNGLVGDPTQRSVQAVVGEVIAVDDPDFSHWYAPDAMVKTGMPTTAQWYVVRLQSVQAADSWQPDYTPWSTSPEQLWLTLADALQPSLKLLRWVSFNEGITQELAIRGVAVENGQVKLLATGPRLDPAPFPPLAFSPNALVWLNPAQASHPSGNQVITPIMQEILRHQEPLPEADSYALASLLTEIYSHQLDLTGDGKPDQVLTFDPSAVDQLLNLGVRCDRTAHKTVILDDQGTVLYSDLFQPQTLVALTNPAAGGALGLLVYGSFGYRLQMWSGTRFGSGR